MLENKDYIVIEGFYQTGDKKTYIYQDIWDKRKIKNFINEYKEVLTLENYY